MARRVFFSFHHARDVWRAGQVRNSWVTQDREAAGFWDAPEWEEVKKKDTATIHRWIDRQMAGTSVTVVLIGAQTATRPHVKYEIEQSVAQKKGLLGIRIHKLKDQNQLTPIVGGQLPPPTTTLLTIGSTTRATKT
jgi:MTH538 TIR-like domain (DUF1863)